MNPATIRLVIDSAVAELGHNAFRCRETILIRGSHFLGRQYRYDGVRAIWLADDEAVRIYSKDGRLLQTLMGIGQPDLMRLAA